jgi:uroporphyrinogen-III synthase
MPRILVTRSEPGASETADRLRQRGHDPIVEPVFAVEAIAATLPAYDAIAFTSANGARVFATLTPDRSQPVFAVGARTADAAREVGFTNVRSADGDVTALGDMLFNDLPANARLLHAGNAETRGDLAGRLAAAGRDATFLPVYRSVPVVSPGPALAAHLSGAAPLDAILVHSPRGAITLAAFLSPSARRAKFAAISTAAAGPVTPFAQQVEIAAAPNEAALLAALDALLRNP